MKKTDKDTEQSNVERNKYTLELVNSWINNADTKISISCGVSSVVIAVIAFWSENILSSFAGNSNLNASMMICFNVVLVISIATFLASLWFYFWALNPNLASGLGKKKELSKRKKAEYSIFFEEIRKFENVNHYIKSADKATEHDFNREILKEIYWNSRICSDKMRRFKTGMWLSVLSIILAVVAFGIYYLAMM